MSNEPTAVEIKYSYVSTFLSKLTEQYLEIEKQCYEFLERKELSEIQNTQENIGPAAGKTPVWVLWWQGEENAPEIIKICLKSMRENFPAELAEIRLLTAENIGEYVSFPEYIVEKYQRGVMSLTHLSDLIRAELLSEYGGMWIDATYFVAGKVPESVFLKQEIWTQKFERPLWTADVVQGRWSINLIKGQAHELLFDFWKEALLFYWQKHDNVIDYYLTDYVIAVAYENLKSIKQELGDCSCSNPELFLLREIINTPFEEKAWEEMCRETQFFKLSYKVKYVENTDEGKQTFYGYIKNKMQDETFHGEKR